MSVEENKGLARRFFDEIFNQANQQTANEILTPNVVAHHPAFPAGIHGPQAINQLVAGFRAAFPDLHYTIEDLIAEDDKVVARWAVRGTQLGNFQGLPPSGRQMAVTGINIFRVAGDKVAEVWISSDFLGMLQQLGALPAFGQGRV